MSDPVTGPLSAAIGIAQLVSTCVQYYEWFISYANQRKDIESYCTLFEVERTTFLNWKAKVMPDSKTVLVQDEAIENLTIACLDQVRIAFEDAESFSKYYGKRKLLDWSIRKEELKNEIQKVSPLRKLSWALEGSKSAAGLLQKLKSYNEALARLWKMSRDSVERQILPELDNFNNVNGLRMMESALKREDDPEYQNLAAAIRLRRVCLETINASKAQIDDPDVAKAIIGLAEKLELNSTDFGDDFFSKTPPPTAVINRQKVLIEWKYYDDKPPHGIKRRQYENAIRTSIRQLAQILAEPSKPWKLRALDCVGFHEVEDGSPISRVCFAFKIPQGVNPEPLSLQRLIEDRKTHPEYVFYLGDRFTLAQGLANTVYQLLCLGWLHKGIRSENIQFYQPAGVEGPWRANPEDFFLMGYEFARPISTTSLSVKPEDTEDSTRYRHPKYLDSATVDYEPRFDLYSLGVVLIEIALWKTARMLAKEWNRDERRTSISLSEWQSVVRRHLVGEVEMKVGRVYAEVVRRCIEGDFGTNTEQMELQGILKAIDRLAVANLERCFA